MNKIIELRQRLNKESFKQNEIQNVIYKVETELANEVFEILKDLFPYLKVIGYDGHQSFLFSTSEKLKECIKHPKTHILTDIIGIEVNFFYEDNKKNYVDEALKRIEKILCLKGE
ncbi:hypothetical protein CFT12S00416_07870 [Campylobacter fetus subsp. testudinum]|uniref:hypothetical protein n=1 Tax=Campylobacter fetus TaxID=196 RepID=UPI00081894E1|nr:hypothetical protein [Campylobacter fetus]OCR87735.1 hypothetical protein CFT12S00416_07870 [Campylobacter fetus subsp. testudinum]OCR98884.1 hypothetical protein A9K75_09495 [Campylobacter fetus subsp. testudinum]